MIALTSKLESKFRNCITQLLAVRDREGYFKMSKNHENKDEFLKLCESSTKSICQRMLQIVYNWDAQMSTINKMNLFINQSELF